MANKYTFSEFIDLASFDQGFAKLNKQFNDLDAKITQREKNYKGTGAQLMEESKRIKELSEAEKELIRIEKERKSLESEIAKANKAAEKEAIDAKRIRVKAEQDAEKFLRQFNAQEIKSNELLKIKKKELRDNARAEAELEIAMKREVKTLADLQRLNSALIKVRKKTDVTTISGKKKYDELTKAIERNNRALKKQDKNIGVFSRNVGNYGSAISGVTRKIVSALGITAGIYGLVSVVKNGIKIFSDFSKGSSKLAAILGKTKDQISGLTNQAKELGSTTAFTASQVIDAQTELAKLGLTTSEIEKSIPGVLSLAAATGSELAPAAELAASTLRIFNFDASEMGRVSDVLAKSTTISSLSMEKLATIMPTVGKTAQLAGVSLERTAALAGTLTDRGLDASTAATSLRNIFLELSKKGLTWNEAMEKINSSIDKNKAALDLFGKRAATAGAILAETSSDTDRLTTSLENATGAAKEMAEVMLDNLAGDITKAQSAWEGFILSLEDGDGVISKILRAVTNKFTGLLTMLKKLNEGESLYLQKLKKDSDFQGQVNKRWEEYNRQILLATSEEKKLFFIRSKTLELQHKIIDIQYSLNIGVRDGVKISGRRRAELEFEISFYNELITRLKNYNKESEASSENKKEETNSTKELTKAEKKLLAQRKKLLAQRKKEREEEQLRRARFRIENELLDPLANQQGQVRSSTKDEIGAYRQKEKEKADAEREQRMLLIGDLESMNRAFLDKKGIEEAEALAESIKFEKKLKEGLLERVNELSAFFVQQRVDTELSKIQSESEAKNEILKKQLEDGEIIQAEYNKKKRALDSKTRTEEARAERRAVLYGIILNSALAFVKALATGNVFKAAKAALLSAAQYSIASAAKIPSFFKGKIGIKGPGTETSDSILARISNGESVVKASATKKSKSLLHLINDEVLTDANARDLIMKYNFSNNSSERYLKSMSQNSQESNMLLKKIGTAMQRKDGSYAVVYPDGSQMNINFNG
jgi:hypothetical protein